MTVIIRPAELRDLAAVQEIARERSLEALDEVQAESGGFLVSRYGLEEYKELLRRVDHFLVAEEDGTVTAFMVAYGSDRLQPDEWLNRQVSTVLPDFIVVKQVATRPDCAGRGLGTALYEEVLTLAGERRVVAAIVTEPHNPASEALHRKLGFEPLLSLTPPDGLPRTVWIH